MKRKSQKTSKNSRNRPKRRPILLIEDNAARSGRRETRVKPNGGAPILIRLHRIVDNTVDVISEASYEIKSLKKEHREGKGAIALGMLDSVIPRAQNSLVVVGPPYSSNRAFVNGVSERRVEFVGELRPSFQVRATSDCGHCSEGALAASALVDRASWRHEEIWLPQLARSVPCRIAELGFFYCGFECPTRVFAVDVGAIDRFHRGTIIGVSTDQSSQVSDLIRALYWVRWIRPLVRRRERTSHKTPNVSDRHGLTLTYRSNIALARLQDQSTVELLATKNQETRSRALLKSSGVLNVAELFAGAGGMGLGFLMSRNREKSYRLVFSAELHPIYVQTLRTNHEYFKRKYRGQSDPVPEILRPIDLNKRTSLEHAALTTRNSGGVDVLIGGPPCRGFSSANRNSWSSNNPHNQLVSIFMRYVEKLKPPVFLMENVQGIMWTAKNGDTKKPISVAKHIFKRMKDAGYLVFPKLLDAVWYGVPQYRTRLFVLGLHKDIGYHIDDFGRWGPFPAPTHGPNAGKPYVTVRDAIADLPSVGNGFTAPEVSYKELSSSALAANPYLKRMRDHAPKTRILDHITSQHAPYVIERYGRIPAGGNWENIAEMMSNYADIRRTHSNIYRRLVWDEPSITIGHYRKSMLVHPDQDRGLSLREASRLQSFPDWFRFAGTAEGTSGGLMHKQQQLANAVCPLVTEALASCILSL